MAYTDLHYLKVRFKASHNSYERDEDFHQQLSWSAAQPWQDGCRGVECDIHRKSDATHGSSVGYFLIGHDSPGPHPFADYLGYLLSWHVNHPGHDPVMVVIDNKSSDGDQTVFPAELDRYLEEWFDRALIYKPADLSPTVGQLVAASLKTGWPTVGQMAGKFLFCLSGTEDWKKYYADHMTAASLCFADYEIADTSATNVALPANRVFVNLNLFTDHYDKWKVLVPSLRARGYVMRGYVLDSAELWQKGLDAGVNVLATDEVTGGNWAKVGNDPFTVI